MRKFIKEYGLLIVSIIVIVALLGLIQAHSHGMKNKVTDAGDNFTAIAEEAQKNIEAIESESNSDSSNEANNSESNKDKSENEKEDEKQGKISTNHGKGTIEELNKWE